VQRPATFDAGGAELRSIGDRAVRAGGVDRNVERRLEARLIEAGEHAPRVDRFHLRERIPILAAARPVQALR
jgi:hypothetical protein